MKKINFSLDSIEPVFQKIAELTKIQRIIISAGAVVALIALFVMVFYMPRIEKIERLGKEIGQNEEKLAKTKRSAREYNKFKDKMEDAKARFHEISQALPNSDEIPSLLTGISQAGKKAGLTFLLFEPQAEIKKDFYAELPIKTSLSGSYHDLGMFFDRLAGLSRIVNVTQFSIGSPKTSGGPLSIGCTAVTYKFVAKSETKDKKKKKK
ncbi:MAG: type 4a pilus biogenesis protein PilO [Deltaproteobacteria bacterium]|nr:type 4a pilus biogenesis protein PilO [Deltaproteobacteria bacterium]